MSFFNRFITTLIYTGFDVLYSIEHRCWHTLKVIVWGVDAKCIILHYKNKKIHLDFNGCDFFAAK